VAALRCDQFVDDDQATPKHLRRLADIGWLRCAEALSARQPGQPHAASADVDADHVPGGRSGNVRVTPAQRTPPQLLQISFFDDFANFGCLGFDQPVIIEICVKCLACANTQDLCMAESTGWGIRHKLCGAALRTVLAACRIRYTLYQIFVLTQ
jgi:hypothetical protein